MIEQMSPQTYRALRRAVELGRWPDGSRLTRQQREDALQAVIAWDARHQEETDRVGYIDRGHKEGERCEEPEAAPLRWLDRGAQDG